MTRFQLLPLVIPDLQAQSSHPKASELPLQNDWPKKLAILQAMGTALGNLDFEFDSVTGESCAIFYTLDLDNEVKASAFSGEAIVTLLEEILTNNGEFE